MHEDLILATGSSIQPSRRKTVNRQMERPSLKRSALRTAREERRISTPQEEAPVAVEMEAPSSRDVLFTEFLMKISSENYSEEREFPEPWKGEEEGYKHDEHFGNHFLWGAYQENSDLAKVAECESENDINIDGPDPVYNLTRCPMYWKLRQQFVKDAASGNEHSFLYAIWRAYNAGRISPDRLVPRTPNERLSERMRTHLMLQKAEAEGKRRREERLEALGKMPSGDEGLVQ